MQQREIMEYLHTGRSVEHALYVIGIHVIGHDEECGTDTLAAKGQDISYGSVQIIRLT